MSTDAYTFQLGMDGFVWFVGVVESVEDVLGVGRCKCRIIGWHDGDTSVLSTAELPWAYPLLPVSSAHAVPNWRPGDWVCGFFLDGKLGQQPILFGVLPAIAQKS
jgi:hypothetical protein